MSEFRFCYLQLQIYNFRFLYPNLRTFQDMLFEYRLFEIVIYQLRMSEFRRSAFRIPISEFSISWLHFYRARWYVTLVCIAKWTFKSVRCHKAHARNPMVRGSSLMWRARGGTTACLCSLYPERMTEYVETDSTGRDYYGMKIPWCQKKPTRNEKVKRQREIPCVLLYAMLAMASTVTHI